MKDKRLVEFLNKNCICEVEVEDALYEMLLYNCFQIICKMMRKDENLKIHILELYRHEKDNVLVTKHIVDTYAGISVSNEEAKVLYNYFIAFLRHHQYV